uniref:Uncharacterized protein n=1 Tax=Myoviridae sp. ctkfK18 TaxID=2825165 RepID=A0A8S5VGK4_9CAUD|nr:MAG TPA: hypothetical protein [Myoviridae sp. ctkfK18]
MDNQYNSTRVGTFNTSNTIFEVTFILILDPF